MIRKQNTLTMGAVKRIYPEHEIVGAEEIYVEKDDGSHAWWKVCCVTKKDAMSYADEIENKKYFLPKVLKVALRLRDWTGNVVVADFAVSELK